MLCLAGCHGVNGKPGEGRAWEQHASVNVLFSAQDCNRIATARPIWAAARPDSAALLLNLIGVLIEQCTFLGNGNARQDCWLRKFWIKHSSFLLTVLVVFRWPTRIPNKNYIWQCSLKAESFWVGRGKVENPMNFNSCTCVFVVALRPSLASHRSVIRGQLTGITPR